MKLVCDNLFQMQTIYHIICHRLIAYNIPFMILSAVVTSLSKERSWFNHYFSSHDVWKSQIHSKKNRHCYSVDIHLLFMKGLFLTPSGLSVVRLLHQLIMLFIFSRKKMIKRYAILWRVKTQKQTVWSNIAETSEK